MASGEPQCELCKGKRWICGCGRPGPHPGRPGRSCSWDSSFAGCPDCNPNETFEDDPLPVPEVEREPFRPSQGQTAVTEAMSGVRLDLELCAICGTNRGVGDHHVIFRSAGGEDGPTMPVCLVCHNRVHDREWTLLIGDEGLEILDREGQLIWRLKRWPEGLGEPGRIVQLLDGMSEAIQIMPEIAPSLLPWQAAEVMRALREAQDSGWRAQTRLIGEFYEFRLPHLTANVDKIMALAQLFALRRSQVYNSVAVADAFKDTPVLEETNLGMGFAIEAARSVDPVMWLQHAEERKDQHPQYSRDDLRDEILREHARKIIPSEPEPSAPPVRRIWAKCLKCGTAGWVERLPVGSDGRPIGEGDPMEDDPD